MSWDGEGYWRRATGNRIAVIEDPDRPIHPSPQQIYVIPITLPFSEGEAVELLKSVGYHGFRAEAVRSQGATLSTTLCATAPNGTRLPVAEAMKVEVAAALKRLLQSGESPLRINEDKDKKR